MSISSIQNHMLDKRPVATVFNYLHNSGVLFLAQ